MMDKDAISTERLMEMLPTDMVVGRTEFEGIDKKWVCCSYYLSASEYGGYYDEYTKEYFYASTMRDVLIKAIQGLVIDKL